MMDKAKAYDEALEKARKLRDDCQKELDKTDKNSQLADLLRAGISAVEMIFPQFIESEDEKFRKYILKCCKECIEANDEGLELSMSTTKKLLAYLEKHEIFSKGEGCYYYADGSYTFIGSLGFGPIEDIKINGERPKTENKSVDLPASVEINGLCVEKQKYDRMKPIYDARESFESALEKAWKDYNDSGARTVDSCEDDYVECAHAKGFREGFLFGLEKQKEQKSDWSEKDEKIIKTIIGVLERNSQVVTCEQRGGTMSASVSYSNKYGEEIAWLKDISLNHKKFIKAVDKLWSNEWSEEDEKDIAHIIQILDDCYAYGRHDLSKTDHENLINKLKSLHSIKQDWTEEDEEIWFALITFFKTYLQKYPPLCKDEKIQANRILKWLNTTIKSFRLHHRYKPTEEQMQALKNSAYGTYQNGDGPALRRLFEDLEKLGVKEHN